MIGHRISAAREAQQADLFDRAEADRLTAEWQGMRAFEAQTKRNRKARAEARQPHAVEQIVYLPPVGSIARSLLANVISRR